jgi:hypothetical protein
MKRIILAAAWLLAACSAPAMQTPAATDEAATGIQIQPQSPADDSTTSPAEGTPAAMPANPLAPQPVDGGLERSNAYVDSAQLLTMESMPLQFSLNVKGSLPNPCHNLRATIAAPDAENKIVIDIYSVNDPTAMCTQVIEPFDVNLALGSFAAGHYTVWLNGQKVAEFDA